MRKFAWLYLFAVLGIAGFLVWEEYGFDLGVGDSGSPEELAKVEVGRTDPSRLNSLLESDRTAKLTVYFEKGESVLSNSAKKQLEEWNQALEGRRVAVLVVGHASQEGAEAFNRQLSIDRAKATAEFLKSLPGNREVELDLSGVGESQPENTPERSRRVTVEFRLVE